MPKRDFGLGALDSLNKYSSPRRKKRDDFGLSGLNSYSLGGGRREKRDDFGLGSMDSYSMYESRPKRSARPRVPFRALNRLKVHTIKQRYRFETRQQKMREREKLKKMKTERKVFGKIESEEQAEKMEAKAARQRSLEGKLRQRYFVNDRGELQEKNSYRVLSFLKSKLKREPKSIYEQGQINLGILLSFLVLVGVFVYTFDTWETFYNAGVAALASYSQGTVIAGVLALGILLVALKVAIYPDEASRATEVPGRYF